MSNPEHRADMTRAIEALLATPEAGRQVARLLTDNAAEMQARVVVAELRIRRAQAVCDRELDELEAARMGGGAASPWARSS